MDFSETQPVSWSRHGGLQSQIQGAGAGGQWGRRRALGSCPLLSPPHPWLPWTSPLCRGCCSMKLHLSNVNKTPWPPSTVFLAPPARPWKLRVDLINQGQGWGRVKREAAGSHVLCHQLRTAGQEWAVELAQRTCQRKGFPTQDSSTGIKEGAWGWKPSFHYRAVCSRSLFLSSSPFSPL